MPSFGTVEITKKLTTLLEKINTDSEAIGKEVDLTAKQGLLTAFNKNIEGERTKLEKDCFDQINDPKKPSCTLESLEAQLVPFNMMLDNALAHVTNEGNEDAPASVNLLTANNRSEFAALNLGSILKDDGFLADCTSVQECCTGRLAIETKVNQENWMDDGYLQHQADRTGSVVVLQEVDTNPKCAKIYWPGQYGVARIIEQKGKYLALQQNTLDGLKEKYFKDSVPSTGETDTIEARWKAHSDQNERLKLTHQHLLKPAGTYTCFQQIVNKVGLDEEVNEKLREFIVEEDRLSPYKSQKSELDSIEAEIVELEKYRDELPELKAPADKFDVVVFKKTRSHYFKEDGTDTRGNGSCGWNVRTRARLVKVCADGTITHNVSSVAGLKGGNGNSHQLLQIMMDDINRLEVGLLTTENIDLLTECFENVVLGASEKLTETEKKIKAQLVEQDKAWLTGLFNPVDMREASTSTRPTAFFIAAEMTSVADGSKPGQQVMLCTLKGKERLSESGASESGASETVTFKVHFSRKPGGIRHISHFQGGIFTCTVESMRDDLVEQVTKMLNEVKDETDQVQVTGFDGMSKLMQGILCEVIKTKSYTVSNEDGLAAIGKYNSSVKTVAPKVEERKSDPVDDTHSVPGV